MKARHLSIILFFALMSCTAGAECTEEMLDKMHDIGSSRWAAKLSRNCGATTGYVTVIKVGRGRQSAAEAGEVFVADSDHGGATDGADGVIWTNIVWYAPGKLSVGYASRARVFKSLPSFDGVSITYQASDRYSPPPPPDMLH